MAIPGAAIEAGRQRMHITTLLAPAQSLCDVLLLRTVSLIDELTRELFGQLLADATSVSANPRLIFATGEPAINVYTSGGGFKAHEDHQVLTVLVPLSEFAEFEGGGTAFWSTHDSEPSRWPGGSRADLRNPTIVLRPAARAALLFGGNVTHSGLPIHSGQRCVFVASFSPQASPHSISTPGNVASEVASRLHQPVSRPFCTAARITASSREHKRIAEILGGRT